MPRISKEKKDKISEQILHFLFSASPEPKFTSEIAEEIARDEEFIKVLLSDLKGKSLINEINRNKSGAQYLRRQRWILSPSAFDVYKKHQSQSQQNLNSNTLSE